jgi:cytochrome c553
MRFQDFVIAALLAAACAGAAAADARISAGQRLAASCANCHGTNGVSAGGAVPGLAGQPKELIQASMRAFKDGSRSSTIMHQLAKGYTDEQIEVIAAYFAAQKQ